MASPYLIGDEIHWDGYLVAVLAATGIPPSSMAAFTDALESGTLHEDAIHAECNECGAEAIVPHLHDCKHYDPKKDIPQDEHYDAVMVDLKANLKPFVKGGLVKMDDIVRVIEQLKEEAGLE